MRAADESRLLNSAPATTHPNMTTADETRLLESTSATAISHPTLHKLENTTHLIAMFCLGVFNNGTFVILNASAKHLLPDAVGGFYLCNSLPSLLVRISAPYWFDRVSYVWRMRAATILMIVAFLIVASSSSNLSLLSGVVLMSVSERAKPCGRRDARKNINNPFGPFFRSAQVQSGLGETTLLSLSSRFSAKTLTAWASGTGIAGVFGYVWVIVLTNWINYSTMLYVSTVFSGVYYFSFSRLNSFPCTSNSSKDVIRLDMTVAERLQLMNSLWRWTIPLLLVYWAEYALQSGVWAIITTDALSSDSFYQYSNLCYQLGVFISRSSGMLFKARTPFLWTMGIGQCVMLAIYLADYELQVSERCDGYFHYCN